MADLSVKFKNLTFKNPIIMASGTFGFGREYNEVYDISQLGGVSGKGLTLNAKPGNNGIRGSIIHVLTHSLRFWVTLLCKPSFSYLDILQ